MQIRLENLKHSYDGIPVIDGISLSIPENKIFGIIGKSGAGKSTLVRLISLLEKPESGFVFYDENRVDNLDKKSLILRRRRLSMIFQNFNLFSSRNAGQNVAYPLEICGYEKAKINDRVIELMKLVGLEDKINAPISSLSGGQKQRVAIARALSTDPDVLFCDEATSALDPQTTRAILSLLKEIQKKMNLTVVMITHQMEVVRDCCDYVAVLSEGKIVEQGTVKEIFKKPKSDVTRDFLAHLVSADIEQSVSWSPIPGRYTLRFPSKGVDVPVISQLSRKYEVDFNIRGGGVQKVKNEEFGTLRVDISGKAEDVENTIRELKALKIIVEEG